MDGGTILLWEYFDGPVESRIYHSVDGINYTLKHTIAGTGKVNAAAFSGTSWVVCGQDGVWRSNDLGETWDKVYSSACTGVAYGDNVFVVARGSSSPIVSVDDGVTWSNTDAGTAAFLGRCLYTGSTFLLFGSANTAYRSTSGATGTWVSTTHTAYNTQNVVTDGADTVIVFGQQSTPTNEVNYSISTDGGATWAAASNAGMPSGADSRAVAFGGGVFVVFGRLLPSGTTWARYSEDGVTWTSASGVSSIGLSNGTLAFAYIHQSSKFLVSKYNIATGYYELGLESTSGATWTEWGGAAHSGVIGLFSALGTSQFWHNFVRSYEV